MGDLGNLLREARERKGITLEQAEAETRIRHRFLSALETGDYSTLPAPAYVRGFLKTYAAYLGLDPQQVLSLFKVVSGANEPESAPAVPLVDVSMEGGRDLRPIIVGLAIVAALLLVAVFFVRLPWKTWFGLQAPVPTATATLAPTATRPQPTLAPTPTQTPQPTATTAAIPSATPQPAGEVRVEFVVTGRSWVQIVADGEVAYAGLLENETREWTAAQSIVARVGNAGAVQATVNGQPLGVLGGAGEVVVQEWMAEGAEPSPTSTP